MRTSPVYATSKPRNEHQQKVLEGVGVWAAYYRSNPHRFVQDYLHIHLKLFQIFLLYLMDWAQSSAIIGSRGIGKSFIAAVFCVYRCILYPGTQIVIASGTRGQSVNVLEKIWNGMRPNSPQLALQIDDKQTKISGQQAKLVFRNTSMIKVVTANDNARSNRANILILDEFRMVRKEVADTILRKFLTSPRSPKFLEKPEYKKEKKKYQELNKTIYLSSAYFADHWSFTRCKDNCRAMLDDSRKSFVCGFPYQLPLLEGLLLEEQVLDQISDSDFNDISWSMEMESEFWGATEGSFFNFDAISKNRHIDYCMLPQSIVSKLPAAVKYRIQPKQQGQKRILSADIALMASTKHKNDATAIFINQMMPTKAGRFSNNIVYTQVNEGLSTQAQSLVIRRLFDEYDCDYIALDVKNFGLSIFDTLAADLADPDTGQVYPALSCCNNADIASRCSVRGAPKVIYAMIGSAKFNSECAVLLREGFRSGRIRLLINEYDAEELFGTIKGYGSLSTADRLSLILPYINTTLLISELINLRHQQSNGFVKISEKSGARKDRYSSLSYNYWVATQIEKDVQRSQFTIQSDSDEFIFRAPSSSKRERW